MRMKTAASFRKTIEDVYNTVSNANACLQQMLPEDKKAAMNDEVKELTVRKEILNKTDERLAFIDDFNKRLAVFNQSVTELEAWLEEGRKRLDMIRNPADGSSPEDRVTKSMEVQEDISKKSDFCAKQEAEKAEIFPKQGEKVSSDAKRFMERIKSEGRVRQVQRGCQVLGRVSDRHQGLLAVAEEGGGSEERRHEEADLAGGGL
jgi:hypothetical protein